MKSKENDKYELIGDKPPYRIKALKDFADVKAGDIGGYVTNKNNLSQKGNCWIYDNGKVYGKAKVYGNARVSGNALVTCVYGRSAFPNPDEVPAKIVGARVYGNAHITNNAIISHNTKVCGNTRVDGDIHVSGDDAANICSRGIISFGNGLPYTVVVTDHHMLINGELYSKLQWEFFDDESAAKAILGVKHHYHYTQKDLDDAKHFWTIFKDLAEKLNLFD